MKAILFVRVATDEACGFKGSLESQLKHLRAYAAEHGIEVVKVITQVGLSRCSSIELLRQSLEQHPDVFAVVMTDPGRVMRRPQDWIALKELVESGRLEIHVASSGEVIRKANASRDRLVLGVRALLAEHYVERLREEVIKGQTIKARMGQYPGRAPYGYRNFPGSQTIEVNDTDASVVRLAFDLYATGDYSLRELQKAVYDRTGKWLSRRHLRRILSCLFYVGQFLWRGCSYRGTHLPLINREVYNRVQKFLSKCSGKQGNGHNRN